MNKKNYRLTKQRVRSILEIIKDDIMPMSLKGGSISADLQTCIAVRYFAKESYHQDIGDLHGVSRSTVSRIIKKGSIALARK